MASASPENIASEKQRRLRKQDKEENYGERKNTRQKMLAGPRANRRCSGIILTGGAGGMGGLLAHTLVSDSGDALWKAFATEPLNSLSLSAPERAVILDYFFFRHEPTIDRVIFLAVPHRGSRLATGVLGSIGNEIVRRPRSPARAIKELKNASPPGRIERIYRQSRDHHK